MKAIAIINQKGGVGKTTTAAELGAALKTEGAAVLFIDLDPQGNLTYTLGGQDARFNVMDVLTGQTSAADAVTKVNDKISLIAASSQLMGADTQITAVGKEYKLKEAIDGLKGYDYIIIDTPPTAGILTVNALTAADTCLIPLQADIYSLAGIKQLYDTITAIKRYCNKHLTISGLLLTRYNGRAIISKDLAAALEQHAQAIGTRLFKTKIRECTAIKEAQAMKTSVFEYAPKSNGAADYAALLKELKEVL
jgi:chromosome partitioning protein